MSGTENQFFLRDDEKWQANNWQMMNGKHLFSKEPMFTSKVHFFSDSVFSTGPDIKWHVCPGDTWVPTLHKLQGFMSKTRHAPESLPRQDLREHVQRHQLGKSEVAKQLCNSSEWSSLLRSKLPTWLLCFCGPGSEKTWTQNEERPSRQLAGGEWNKLAVRMKDKLITSMHPVIKGSNMLHTGALMKRKKGGRVGTHFRNEADNHSHARRNDLGVQSTLSVFRTEQMDPEPDATSDSNHHCRVASGKKSQRQLTTDHKVVQCVSICLPHHE